MSRNDEAAVELLKLLVKAPWWVGISISAGMLIASAIVGRTSFGLIFPIEKLVSSLLMWGAIGPALCGVISLVCQQMNGRMFDKASSLDAIKALSWQEFESLIGEYYRRKGYAVFEMGGDAPDGGIDLLAQKNGENLVIQCKHWKAFKVDVKVARELYGVMVDSTASGAVLITTGDFTQPTVDFVKDKPIELVDGPKLAKLMAVAKAVVQKPVIPAKSRAVLIPTEPPPLRKEEKDRVFMPPAMRAELEAREKSQAFTDGNPVCPDCKTYMVLRVAQRGPTSGSKFWGCPNYPKCRNTINFETNKA